MNPSQDVPMRKAFWVMGHVFRSASLLAVSSMFKCSCAGNLAAASSYDGRKASVTWFWIFTVSAALHGWEYKGGRLLLGSASSSGRENRQSYPD
jgi:hypothetical protein